jgi:hypothetical protein
VFVSLNIENKTEKKQENKQFKTNVMKTKIKTIATIAACAILGMTSMTSFAGEKKTAALEAKTDSFADLSNLSGENALYMMEAITSEGSDAIIAQYADRQVSEIESEEAAEFENAVKQITEESAAMETAKYAEMQILAIQENDLK